MKDKLVIFSIKIVLYKKISKETCKPHESSSCSKTCGEGTQTRTYICQQSYRGEMMGESTFKTETVRCNISPCPTPVVPQCKWSPWTESACSATCGGGIRVITRSCLGEGQMTMKTESEQIRCNVFDCVPPTRTYPPCSGSNCYNPCVGTNCQQPCTGSYCGGTTFVQPPAPQPCTGYGCERTIIGPQPCYGSRCQTYQPPRQPCTSYGCRTVQPPPQPCTSYGCRTVTSGSYGCNNYRCRTSGGQYYGK